MESHDNDTLYSDTLYKIRHSLAHVLAQAVLQVRPKAKLGFGPPIDTGFYYDFMFEEPLREEDLKDIEKRMRKIIGQKQEFQQASKDATQAVNFLKETDQNFKVEYCEELISKGETDLGFFTNGPFIDMCRGPHVKHTGELPPDCFQLDSLAGAYWRGSEKNPQLTRIYGLAFNNKIELEEYIQKRELTRARDHRKLGVELEIFAFSQEIGAGLPLWLPNGTIIREELEHLAKEVERKAGYMRVSTPHITKDKLYYKSKHLPYYSDTMYAPMEIDGELFYLKPMNCPHHHEIYLSAKRSYRDLPLRLAELGQCYRYENSGALSGLMRVRGFCQNDAHIYCRYDQAKDEFLNVMRMHAWYYELFGIKDYFMRFSKPDMNNLEKYVNEPQKWIQSMEIMYEAMKESGFKYVEADGEAAFYGPKIDFMVNSAIGNEYAISTNQLDFLATETFNLKYIGEDGNEHPLYVIHRAPLGSHERFIGFLIEHYGGAFPTWLSPTQVVVVPIADRHNEFAHKVKVELAGCSAPTAMGGGVRVEVDDSRESMQKKIRNAQKRKIPYVLVVGDKEQADNSVAVRLRTGENLGAMPVAQFIEKITIEIKDRVGC